MLSIAPQIALQLAHEHADHLCAEAAAGRSARSFAARHALATLLHTAADRLDRPTTLVQRPA